MFGLNENEAQSADTNNAGQPPAADTAQPNPFTDAASPAPAPVPPADPAGAQPVQDIPPAPTLPPTAGEDDLLQLKEQALHSLQPLVGHLDQTPEEKFKTTMMMIQATDNSSLVKDAYEAANQIPDEKSRAQALLDVVNEINYFTQHNGEAEAKA